MEFDVFYMNHARKIEQLAREFSRSCRSLHDDFVSALAERLWHVYCKGYHVDGLIYVALRRAAIDVYRKHRQTYRFAELTEDLSAAESVEPAALDRIEVEELMNRCPNRSARAMAVAYYRGYTYSEIGRDSGLHHEVVRRTIQRLAS